MHQLYYANGSKILSWVGLVPSDIFIVTERDLLRQEKKVTIPVVAVSKEPETVVGPPEAVKKWSSFSGQTFSRSRLDVPGNHAGSLSVFFADSRLSRCVLFSLPQTIPFSKPLFCFGFWRRCFRVCGSFVLRHSNRFPRGKMLRISIRSLKTGLNIRKKFSIKIFSADFKAYTHQVYTQPDFRKNPYGRKLLSNMYTLIKAMFLPYFDISLYGSARMQKDDRLPPLYTRVSQLKRLLDRYYAAIQADSIKTEKDPEASIPGIMNPWEPYKFDIANTVSTRLDALFGGKHTKHKTNAVLVECTLSVVNVLDWWINDKNSYAYQTSPKYLYRVIEPGSSVPAFGVKPRTDIDALFAKHLKVQAPLMEARGSFSS